MALQKVRKNSAFGRKLVAVHDCGWAEFDGPSSGAGAEYHYECSCGRPYTAYVAIDQGDGRLEVFAPEGGEPLHAESWTEGEGD